MPDSWLVMRLALICSSHICKPLRLKKSIVPLENMALEGLVGPERLEDAEDVEDLREVDIVCEYVNLSLWDRVWRSRR